MIMKHISDPRIFDTPHSKRLDRRKGALHTLEAIIAFLMVIGFIVFVMPAINKNDAGSAQTRLYAYRALSDMEKTGQLESLAAAENLSGIKSVLNNMLALPMKFTVGLSKTNASSGTIYPKEGNVPAYINFTANTSTLDSATLRLTYINASGPAVYANGQYLTSHAGDYSGNKETFEIAPYAQTGANSVMLNTSNNATISYRLMLVESKNLEAPEENKSIITVGYIVSGNGSSFAPREIRVYVWR